MSSSLIPESSQQTMNNLDEPSSSTGNSLPIPKPEPWELPSVSLLSRQSPFYTSSSLHNSSLLHGPMIPSISPSSPALTTSTPKRRSHEKESPPPLPMPSHQSRATTSMSSTGVRPKRNGSVEKSHRPRNYRSPHHQVSSKCDYLPSVQRSQARTEIIAHSLSTKVDSSENVGVHDRKFKGMKVEAGGDASATATAADRMSLSTISSSNDGDSENDDDDDDDGDDDEPAADRDDNPSSSNKKSFTTTNGQVSRLQHEHKILYDCLDHGRKALIVRKALNAFMYGALRKQSESLHLLQMRVKMKSEENAARLILHSLLLNSYRRTKRDLDAATAENAQRNKSVENLCLQLRVVRHLQATEKGKIIEKCHEISTLKSELSLLQDEHERSKKKLQTVEKQLYEEQNHNEKLSKEKLQIQDELRTAQEKIDLLNESLKLEKKQATKYIDTSKQLKRKISEAKQQIKDLIYQSTHWQERAQSYESENVELELHVKSGDEGYDELKRAFDELLEENRVLVSENESLLSQKSLIETKLDQTNHETTNLKHDLNQAKQELERQKLAAIELQEILSRCRDENLAMEDELFTYRVAHVRKRRIWFQFLMSIINPLETIRLFVCHPTSTTTRTTTTREVIPTSLSSEYE